MKDSSSNVTGKSAADLHLQMISLFCELGPFEHTEIARRLSVSRSSVFRYYQRLLRGRIMFVPDVNRWALGLRRVVVRVTFSPEFVSYGKEICVELAHCAYLAYFGRLMPENEWMLHFQVPFEHQGILWKFLGKLEEMQVLKLKGVYETDLRVGAPFRAEYFDPEAMRFNFDWSSIRPSSYVPDPAPLYQERFSFDAKDLRIVEWMQTEPLKTTEVARKAELGLRETYWHLKKHVMGTIIKGWYLNWLGTWILDQSPKAMSRREFTGINAFAKSLSPGELKTVREKFNSLPYLWSEHIGKSDIVLQVHVRNESLGDLYAYLGELDDSIKSKMVLRMEDQSKAILFTVPRNLYDEEKGWTFDFGYVLERFEGIAVAVRNSDRWKLEST